MLAKSDEHLSILSQLTKVLSNDSVEELLKNATQAETIVALLSGKTQSETLFDQDLVALNFPVKDVSQLAASASGLLKNKGAVEQSFITDAMNKIVYLGQGLCLVASNKGVQKTALSFVSSDKPLQYQGESVKGLLCLASDNELHFKNLSFLIELLYKKNIEQLFNASEAEVINLLTQEKVEGAQQVFTIKNPHGLHARPGALLVNTAKKFKSKIQMTNLDGNGKTESAKSLMKVMTQGIKFGDRLEFTAQGDDAEEALMAIGKAIEEGLGEK
ncbi:fused PTS fructose transporter subunit IIA/HPr protein [Psychromonas sp. KJ10-10]|uniref:fused PTS fructose transporter subunit IIA/HPr protein n=1 Tax=Psychromonas sp. KJ10-10 TaxID=3391823 RepID=UPI0039B38C5E